MGGRHFYAMPGPDGALMYGLQRFHEIVPLRKVVLEQSFADKDGNVALHPMAPTWPRAMLSTSDYQDMGDATTRLSVTWLPVAPTAEELATFEGARAGMSIGWDHMFGMMASYLAGL